MRDYDLLTIFLLLFVFGLVLLDVLLRLNTIKLLNKAVKEAGEVCVCPQNNDGFVVYEGSGFVFINKSLLFNYSGGVK